MTKSPPKSKREGYLDGQMLVAMPGMTDERFMRSVIYVCAHSQDGAMGIVVNHPAQKVTFSEILLQLEVVGSAADMQRAIEKVPVVRGGPVEASRGFVLHTPDYYVDNSTLPIDDAVSLTATLDILRAIADGTGPAKAVLALGYAGWSAGQLETEIQANGWLNCTADSELLFDPALDDKYGRALQKIGIDPAQLSTQLSAQAGHA